MACGIRTRTGRGPCPRADGQAGAGDAQRAKF
nr:MAG TPA: hypothetical protein [Caudoviricetes sp.]